MIKIPFYSNTPDDTHCFQAVMKSILKYYFPEREYSWEELDKITNKAPGKWTWPMAGLMYLKQLGLEVKNVELFDYEEFYKRGGEYLIEQWGEEAGRASIEHGDPNDHLMAKDFAASGITENRPATFDELQKLFRQGYILVCWVNSYTLDNESGYAGHFVIITDISDDYVILHDSGLPPIPNRKVDRATFEKAWEKRNYMAIRK
jgi:hypothetical protein